MDYNKLTKEQIIRLLKDTLEYVEKQESIINKKKELITDLLKRIADLEYEVEHYVISSGLKEIIEGSSIAKHLKRIYSN